MLVSRTEEESEHDEGPEATKDYSHMKMPSGKSLTPLEDVNTKLYIGTEVNTANKVEVYFIVKMLSACKISLELLDVQKFGINNDLNSITNTIFIFIFTKVR